MTLVDIWFFSVSLCV